MKWFLCAVFLLRSAVSDKSTNTKSVYDDHNDDDDVNADSNEINFPVKYI